MARHHGLGVSHSSTEATPGFTDALSGEAYISVSYLKPVIHLLNTEILSPKESDTELTKEIKTKALEYLNDKYTDPATDELLTMATFMDPIFKTMYMSTEKLEEIKVRAASETEALLVENSALVESSLAEDQPEREREAATAPLSISQEGPGRALAASLRRPAVHPPHVHRGRSSSKS